MVSEPLNIKNDQIVVELTFGYSASHYYKEAILLAQELPHYKKSGRERQEKHIVKISLPIDDLILWDRVGKLVSLAGHWKKSKVNIY